MESPYYLDSEKMEQTVMSARRELMRNVYLWMTLALGITGVFSYVLAQSGTMLTWLYGHPGALIFLAIAELALVILLTAKIQDLSFVGATLMFVLYSLLTGVTFSSIFIVYTQETITSTFLITAGTFAAMALLGSVTKKDLSGLGRFFLMALIGLIIASIVNIFVANSQLDWIISIVGVVLFSALTAYDAQKIQYMLNAYGNEVNDQSNKIALLGSLTLYLDFINLFLHLLRLMGRRD